MEFSIIERRDGMKCNSVIGILGMFLFAYTTNGQSLVCKSNNVGRCESRDEAAEIDRIEGSEQKWDVETVIAHEKCYFLRPIRSIMTLKRHVKGLRNVQMLRNAIAIFVISWQTPARSD